MGAAGMGMGAGWMSALMLMWMMYLYLCLSLEQAYSLFRFWTCNSIMKARSEVCSGCME